MNNITEVVDLFENNDKCDFVLTDVLFTFSEIYSIVNNNQVNKIKNNQNN